jgi:predicted nucleic acid-binding protein
MTSLNDSMKNFGQHGEDFDLADCCIMALSERLNITYISTLDRRDFSIFRPRHCDYLTLLPDG